MFYSVGVLYPGLNYCVSFPSHSHSSSFIVISSENMANEVVKHKAVAPEVTTRRILPTVKTSRNIEVTEMLKCPACGAQMMVMGRGERCAVIAKMDPASLWFDQVAFTCPGAKECQICARCIKPWLTCTCPWGHARFIPWYAAAMLQGRRPGYGR